MGKDLFNPHLHKFSIRKLNVGVCSVLLSTLVLLGTAANASADEVSDSGDRQETASLVSDDGSSQPVSAVSASQPLEVHEQPSPALAGAAGAEAPAQGTENAATAHPEQPSLQPEAASDQSGQDQTAAALSESGAEPQAIPAVSPDERSRRTPSYPVQPTAKPATASMPRSSLNGQPMTRGTGFRATAAAAGSSTLEDATSSPKVAKPTLAESERKSADDLMKQVTWLDFGDTAALTNTGPDNSFQIGTVYSKEIAPNYRITLTVTELKPFNATEIYKNRVQGTGKENTYNPNAENTWLSFSPRYGDKDSKPLIVGAVQDQWTAIQSGGIDTKGRKTQLLVHTDGANYGVKFKVEATYHGKPVKAAIVMADGEEANPAEFAIFTTNGTGWSHLAEWKRGNITDTYEPIDQWITGHEIFSDTSVDWLSYISPDQETGGLGSQVFGPNVSKGRTIPIVMTRGASEVGFYVASAGQQAAMLGVMVVDEGDAPASYGEVHHAMSSINALTGQENPQPYLGGVPADVDTAIGHDWNFDDKDQMGDEGVRQLLTDEQFRDTNALLDLQKAKDGTYTLKVRANANSSSPAYMKAWVDFNQNGKFDAEEGSQVTTVTAKGDYTLTFNAIPNLTVTQVEQLGFRVRISSNEGDIDLPTGTAFSGEVEDFQIKRTYPPRGEKVIAYGRQPGYSISKIVRFTPQGPDKSDFISSSKMSLEDKDIQVLDTDGQPIEAIGSEDNKYYARPEGQYSLRIYGNDIQVDFSPAQGFTGIGQGIIIRRKDSNGASTGWKSTESSNPNVNDRLQTMDGLFIPALLRQTSLVSYTHQGVELTEKIVFNDAGDRKTPVEPSADRPVRFLDANGKPINDTRIPAIDYHQQQIGTIELDPLTGLITFKPNKTYSYGAYGESIIMFLELEDEEGYRHLADYQAFIDPVNPQGQNATSVGAQGAQQTGQLIFTQGHDKVPIDSSVLPTFDNGSQTKTVAGVGTYTVDNNNLVTFQPEPGYSGKPAAETVKRVDTNGTEATATYQAEVKAVSPTGSDMTSSGYQREEQSESLTFKAGEVEIDGQTVEVPLKTEMPRFVVDGQVQEGPTLVVRDAQNKVQGTYTIHADGSVSFLSAGYFYGTPTPARIRAVDINGTAVEATYQPTVLKVVPTAMSADSSGDQGWPQTAQVVFETGNSEVGFPEDTQPLFEDGSNRKEIPDVGVFEMKRNGTLPYATIDFTPVKTFVGQTPLIGISWADVNGTVVKTTYQATVRPVFPTGHNASSTGFQGLKQNRWVDFLGGGGHGMDNSVPAVFVENNSDTLIVPNVGKFYVYPDGDVHFTPEKTFVGQAGPVSIRRVNVNGTPGVGTYTATVIAVTPTATGDKTEGLQGQTQTGQLTFTAGNPAVGFPKDSTPVFDNGSNIKEVENVGKFEVDAKGKVTFTPAKNFTGQTAEIQVSYTDINGTVALATYQATVTAVTPTATGAKTEGLQGQVQIGQLIFTAGDSAVPMDDTKPATFEDGTTHKEIPNVGVFEVAPDGTVTFTPEKAYVGTTDPITVKRVDHNGTPVIATYTATVEKVTPTATGAKTEGLQGQVQTGQLTFTAGNPSVGFPANSTPVFDNGTNVKEVEKVGKFEVDAKGKVTFTPVKSFTGQTTEMEISWADVNGTVARTTYQATVKAVSPTGTDIATTGKQGQPQSGTPVFTAGDPSVELDDTVPATFEDGSTRKEVPNVGVFEVAPDGIVTFTPDKAYVGTTEAVAVKRVDRNGTPVTANYTATVEKVTPTATGAKSEGLQGQVQTGQLTFRAGDPAVGFPANSTPVFDNGSNVKEVENVGKFEVDAKGKVTFTPVKSFTGKTDEITVSYADINGTVAKATYQATVKAVSPTGTDIATTGKQGQPQTGTPNFTAGDPSVQLDDTVPAIFEDGSTRKEVPNVGVFGVAPDGTVTFTPDKAYVGTTESVTVKRVDRNGTPVTANYTATVEKVTPTATGAKSEGLQGQVQTGQLTFRAGDPAVGFPANSTPVFDNGTNVKEVANVGKFEVDAQGTVTFTPVKIFTGQTPELEISRTDVNGTVVKTTYQATVKVVTPTGTAVETSNIKGVRQTGRPIFTAGDPSVELDSTIPATFDDGSQEKVIAGEGRYTVSPDGTVTFTPQEDFLGQGSGVTVLRQDVNGTPVQAQFIPTVTEPSLGKAASSIGNKGQRQTGRPVFEGSIDSSVQPTFADGSTQLHVPGQGSYSIDADGLISFVPEADFVGMASEVLVKRQDIYGNEVTASYQATVLGKASSEADISVGLKGQTQTGKPIFDGDIDTNVSPTFDDGSTVKLISGEGMYTLHPDGTITFTPDPAFVGQATGVTVVRKDLNGNSIFATYRPRVVEMTLPSEDPAQPVQTRTQAEKLAFVGPQDKQVQLPKTGSRATDYTAAALLAASAGLGMLGLAKRRKSSEEE